ncbi:uncharacterized protein N7477_008631 [Penicillium maclennaniae]|uniref:uncharacterized protein n=1 Tax=Penicillium maclennaniae TaxID=1343394 RepID=UPI002540B4F9|nr:uncharacterized protein N7477_008631 [Penicillium maclennaniae]KAJ5666183.1 hypothetical protein N7477_008631 [Penicillium maclennaniae]
MNTQLAEFLAIGEEVTDAEEEAFLLFSQEIPTGNLGFVDSRATTVDVTIRGNEYSIHQSPTLLASSRAGGTTGAVLWKITPLFAEWISSPSNPLRTHGFLSSDSVVTELGCGISALVALALAPIVQHYIATDQEGGKAKGKSAPNKQSVGNPTVSNITFTTLDWETDQPGLLKACIESDTSGRDTRRNNEDDEEEDLGFDLVLSCDCIYNEALVAPFVRTCAEIAHLRPAYNPAEEPVSQSRRLPTVYIIAQQQRSPEVFETWLRETLREFRVWRLSDEALGNGLKSGKGYLVHLLLARETK